MNRRFVSTITHTLAAAALVASAALPAAAQTPAPAAAPAPAPASASKFGIADNSFLVEEAFNQEFGIFQNIFVMTRSHTGLWSGSFTQEWPVPGMKHQFSYTIPLSVFDGSASLGDALINYRYQMLDGANGTVAFSPRLSLVVPTSKEGREFGASGAGLQMNLPVSKQTGSVFIHLNAGTTMIREAGSGTPWQQTPFAAGSVIVAVRPMFNLMVEAYTESRPGLKDRDVSTTIAPGFRTGINVGDKQWIVGVAVPITRGAVRDHGVLGYLSYELPFRKLAK